MACGDNEIDRSLLSSEPTPVQAPSPDSLPASPQQELARPEAPRDGALTRASDLARTARQAAGKGLAGMAVAGMVAAASAGVAPTPSAGIDFLGDLGARGLAQEIANMAKEATDAIRRREEVQSAFDSVPRAAEYGEHRSLE